MVVELSVNPNATAIITGILGQVTVKGRVAEIVRDDSLTLGFGWRVTDGQTRTPRKAIRKIFDYWAVELARQHRAQCAMAREDGKTGQ